VEVKLCNVALLRELCSQANAFANANYAKKPLEAVLFARLAVDLHAVENLVQLDAYAKLTKGLMERLDVLEQQLGMFHPAQTCERCGVQGTDEIPVKKWPDGVYCDNRDGCDWRKSRAAGVTVQAEAAPLACEHCGQLDTAGSMSEYGDGSLLCEDYDACVERAQKDRESA
jgi:hypothetical protein